MSSRQASSYPVHNRTGDNCTRNKRTQDNCIGNKRTGNYTVFLTGMGWMGLVSTDRGVFASVLPQADKNKAESELLSRVDFPPEFSPPAFAALENDLQAYFRGADREIKCSLDWSWATPFQRRVLQVVKKIPRGSVLTYGEVARLAGSPGGARAVGGALAANQVPVILPCHRVVGRNGSLGGFTGAAPELKARLLALEGVVLGQANPQV